MEVCAGGGQGVGPSLAQAAVTSRICRIHSAAVLVSRNDLFAKWGALALGVVQAVSFLCNKNKRTISLESTFSWKNSLRRAHLVLLQLGFHYNY